MYFIVILFLWNGFFFIICNSSLLSKGGTVTIKGGPLVAQAGWWSVYLFEGAEPELNHSVGRKVTHLRGV